MYDSHINKKTTHIDPRLAFAMDVDMKNGDNFRQRFDASATTDQILQGSDMSDMVVIVTGASAGIGELYVICYCVHVCMFTPCKNTAF